MKKYFMLISMLSSSLVVIVFFWVESAKEKDLRVGASLPVVKYVNRDGPQVLKTDSAHLLIVVYFSSACTHCLYQLDLFEKNTELCDKMKLVFLTSEAGFIAKGDEKRWIKLSTQKNCTMGLVNRLEFLKAFGTRITPSIFVFDQRGVLRFRFYGETKIEKLKEILAER